jgi:hypothetical protein
MTSRRGRPAANLHPCPGQCGYNIPRGLFACRDDWRRLPLAIRDRITFGYSNRGADPATHRRAMAEGVAWFRRNPRERAS